MEANILVVDDDKSIRNLIKVYLENEGYNAMEASNGAEALIMLNENKFDLVILDVMMPILDGISTCMKIRESYIMPIIFLSAKDEEIHKIEGLTVGADDYITKPFSSMEVIARVKAQLRRYKKFNFDSQNTSSITIDDLTIDFDSHEVIVRGDKIRLTPKEFDILECLAKNRGVVFSVQRLYETIWNENFAVSDTSIVVHITNLRQKIELDPKNPKFVKTVWGVGYKL